MMQEDTRLRNSLQMKVGSIELYYDSKSIRKLYKDKVKMRKGLPHVLGTHLQLKDLEFCQDIPLCKGIDQSSSVTPNGGNRFHRNRLSVDPVQQPNEM